MADNPTLEIISDTEADIVKGSVRWKLMGGLASVIITNYRHCLTHAETGANDAAFYLWGLTNGLHHAYTIQAEHAIERAARRRLDGDPDL